MQGKAGWVMMDGTEHTQAKNPIIQRKIKEIHHPIAMTRITSLNPPCQALEERSMCAPPPPPPKPTLPLPFLLLHHDSSINTPMTLFLLPILTLRSLAFPTTGARITTSANIDAKASSRFLRDPSLAL